MPFVWDTVRMTRRTMTSVSALHDLVKGLLLDIDPERRMSCPRTMYIDTHKHTQFNTSAEGIGQFVHSLLSSSRHYTLDYPLFAIHPSSISITLANATFLRVSLSPTRPSEVEADPPFMTTPLIFAATMCRLPLDLMRKIIEVVKQPLPRPGDPDVTWKDLNQADLVSLMRASRVRLLKYC
jgi:hypothetical protein